MNKKSIVILFFILALKSLSAHPHIFIDYNLKINKNSTASLDWTFDPIESEKNLYYFDNNFDGEIDDDEAQILFDEGFKLIKEYNYLLLLRLDNQEIKIKDVSNFSVKVEDDKRLTYSFNIKLPKLGKNQKLSIAHFDTTYFISFAEPTERGVVFEEDLYSIIVKNRDKPYYYDPSAGPDVVLDTSKPQIGWIKAYPTEIIISREPILDSFGSYKISLKEKGLQIQKALYFKLSSYLITLRDGVNKTSYIIILLIALLYGSAHALGPGHRKVVISSYLLSHRGATYLKATLISLTSALIHSGTGVFIVLLINILFKRVKQDFIDSISLSLGSISYISLLVLCIILILIKAFKSRNEKVNGSKRLGLALIILTSLIPCPGAITIMLFSLSLGIIHIGVITVLAMSLGIGLTLTGVSLLTIKGKSLTRMLPESKMVITQRIIEWSGLIIILIFSLFMTLSLL